MNYQADIGIETHVQLKTKSKLFCGCDNDAREKEPNSVICPVCLGLPGTLPVLNEGAIKLAIRAGLALNGEVAKQTKFDRKNYFYPDLPKGYQITQYDQPIVGRGQVEVPVGGQMVTVGITRAHLEEDAGKLTHPPGADYSLVDLNRAGTPLLEIVSEPDIHSAAEAKAYTQEIYNLIRYADVSDADLYYGNMRFDVNVSVRPEGATALGTRSETKNLNSFRAVERTVAFEIKRQTELLDRGEKIVQETRGWDDVHSRTVSQRSKEEAHDYRYFPEPDLPPLVITTEMITTVKQLMPPLPAEIRRSIIELGLAKQEAEVIAADPDLAAVFTKRLPSLETDGSVIGLIAKNIVRDSALRQVIKGFSDEQMGSLLAASAAALENRLNTPQYRQALESITTGQLFDADQHRQVSGLTELEQIVDEVMAENPAAVADYKRGQSRAHGFLVGQVMKKSRGQANPPMVNDILKQKLTS